MVCCGDRLSWRRVHMAHGRGPVLDGQMRMAQGPGASVHGYIRN